MVKRKRGRPKKSDKERFVNKRKGRTPKEPSNLNYWRFVVKANEAEIFINKGNDRQKGDLKRALKYFKCFEPELFEETNGKELMKKLKG